MTTRTAKVYLSQIREQLTDDNIDLSFNIHHDFADCMTNRGADIYSIFCARYYESFSRAKISLTLTSLLFYRQFCDLPTGRGELELKNDKR
jgi:hypothetical protein